MAKINLLDAFIYNRISAGEVVERPASIVKELVENAIDAGADDIAIEIVDGGITSITVTDNGCGMDTEDLSLCCKAHATSKITTADQLFRIATMGFRGEALASISAVSQLSIKSKTHDADAATVCEYDEGEVTVTSHCSGNTGTSVTAKNLFYNTPARREYLKKPKAEEATITALVARLIVANPHIRIAYSANGKEIYQSTGTTKLAAIQTIAPLNIVPSLLSGDYNYRDMIITGYLTHPKAYLNNKNQQIITLNGRIINNTTITTAIYRGYGESLMKGNHPAVYIDIRMPFDKLDVNVTPSKTDVRFADTDNVFRSVYQFVRQTLDTAYTAERTELLGEKPKVNTEDNTSATATANADNVVQNQAASTAEQGFFSANMFRDFSFSEQSQGLRDSGSSLPSDGFRLITDTTADSATTPTASNQAYTQEIDATSAIPTNTTISQNTYTSTETRNALSYTIVGQLFASFILVEQGDKLLVIDQHAVIERLKYDELLTAFSRGDTAAQYMMFPEVVEFDYADYEAILSLLPNLRRIGFEINDFGSSSIKVDAVPIITPNIDCDAFLREIIEYAAVGTDVLPSRIAAALASRACKSSARAGDLMSAEELRILCDRIFADSEHLPLQCPHGRPTMFTITKEELYKRFRRIV